MWILGDPPRHIDAVGVRSHHQSHFTPLSGVQRLSRLFSRLALGVWALLVLLTPGNPPSMQVLSISVHLAHAKWAADNLMIPTVAWVIAETVRIADDNAQID